MKNLKHKLLFLGAVTAITANQALADISISNDGTVSGSLNAGPFMGMAGVVVVLMGAMFAVKKAIGLLR